MSSADPDETLLENESDDDDLWEEVVLPEESTLAPTGYDQLEDLELEASSSARPNIEITLKKAASKKDQGEDGKKKAIGVSPAERRLRIDVHKVHTVALLLNVRARNKWINDKLLQARLLSLTPLWVQDQFAGIHKSRIPNAYKRGTMFELAITRMAEWWAQSFFDVLESGHLRSRTFDEVQQLLVEKGFLDPSLLHPVGPDPEEKAELEKLRSRWKGKGQPPRSLKAKGKQKAPPPPPDVDWLDFISEDEDVEVIRSEKSLMKHVLQRSGSRDISAQLFTALCRAMGIPARLVCSLQSVPWQASVGRLKPKAKPKGKGKAKAKADPEANTEEEDDTSSFPGVGARLDGTTSKGNSKASVAPVIKLRKSKSKGQKLGSSRASEPLDPITSPPVFWTEIFSKPDGRWMPVDPIRAIVNKPRLFDPSAPLNHAAFPGAAAARAARVDNRMQYVIAFEEDGYARELTARYAREYGAKVAKSQAGGRGQRQWWEGVMGWVTRPYRLNRDDVEDEELTANRYNEPMPTTMTGFKDHALYALHRHLHQDEIIAPHTPELGKFRGESVYPRTSVLQLKTAENWMRRGRQIRAGEQALKQVKQRASTIYRKRELEALREAGAGGEAESMQGLYAERQTEIYEPLPVIDGVIPKNDFGNIDLYVPSMLPQGAAHIPYRGTAKIARQLGFNFAEAVTGFEFRKGRANPIISGIVLAQENEAPVLEAYWEAEQAAAEKDAEKRHAAVIKRWTRLVQGLRMRQRLQAQYGSRPESSNAIAIAEPAEADAHVPAGPGGFLAQPDDVVTAYRLPRNYYAMSAQEPPDTPLSVVSRLQASPNPLTPGGSNGAPSTTLFMEEVEVGLREADDVGPVTSVPVEGPILSLAELAAANASRLSDTPASADDAVLEDDSLRNGKLQAGLPKARPVRSTRATRTNNRPKRATPSRKRTRAEGSSPDASDEETEQAPKTRTLKRMRVPAVLPPRSDRVLRTRSGRGAAQVQQEQEEALREALDESDD